MEFLRSLFSFLKRLLSPLKLAFGNERGIATLTATQIAQLDNAIPERLNDSLTEVIL